MRRWIWLLAVWMAVSARAQENILPQILALTGAVEEESLDQEVVEKYEYLHAKPLKVNMASSMELSASGLFTPYQAASIIDYRISHGDILSPAELSLIDGFSENLARSMKYFVSFESGSAIGERPGKDKATVTVSAKSAVKGADWSYGVKARITSDFLDAGVTARTVYADKDAIPSSWGLFTQIRGRKLSLTLGDFNARFGQGLTLWSGFSLSGLSSLGAFARRPSGISPSWSYSNTSLRGAAILYSLRRFTVSALVSFPYLRPWCEEGKKLKADVEPALNLAWLLRSGQVSVSALHDFSDRKRSKLAVDGRFCLRGTDLFGEMAYDVRNRKIGAIAGTVIPLGNVRLGVSGRYYQEGFDGAGAGAVRSSGKVTDECALSLGLSFKGTELTADALSHPSSGKKQLKILASRTFQFSSKSAVKLRFSERLRSYERSKSDLRADISHNFGSVSATIRLNWLSCEKYGLLGYAETGYKDDKMSLYLRAVFFKADSWNDRIYCYERDAPGNFNVPAYYGRGYGLSAVAGRKFALGKVRLKAYLRGSMVSYPWMKIPKKASAEARLSISLDF